jgi:hypothetical protein
LSNLQSSAIRKDSCGSGRQIQLGGTANVQGEFELNDLPWKSHQFYYLIELYLQNLKRGGFPFFNEAALLSIIVSYF